MACRYHTAAARSGVPDGYLVIAGQRRVLRRGTDQLVPTPARWRARQASPANSRLVGEKTALVAVDVALSRNAMMNRTAAAKPSIAASFQLVAQMNKGPEIPQAGWPGGQPCRPESMWAGRRSCLRQCPAASGGGLLGGRSRTLHGITCLPELEVISAATGVRGQLEIA